MSNFKWLAYCLSRMEIKTSQFLPRGYLYMHPNTLAGDPTRDALPLHPIPLDAPIQPDSDEKPPEGHPGRTSGAPGPYSGTGDRRSGQERRQSPTWRGWLDRGTGLRKQNRRAVDSYWVEIFKQTGCWQTHD